MTCMEPCCARVRLGQGRAGRGAGRGLGAAGTPRGCWRREFAWLVRGASAAARAGCGRLGMGSAPLVATDGGVMWIRRWAWAAGRAAAAHPWTFLEKSNSTRLLYC